MVIYYDNKGMIHMVEHNVMQPGFDSNWTFEEVVKSYEEEGLKFIGIPYELEGDVLRNYKVILDNKGEFAALHPRGVGEFD